MVRFFQDSRRREASVQCKPAHLIANQWSLISRRQIRPATSLLGMLRAAKKTCWLAAQPVLLLQLLLLLPLLLQLQLPIFMDPRIITFCHIRETEYLKNAKLNAYFIQTSQELLLYIILIVGHSGSRSFWSARSSKTWLVTPDFFVHVQNKTSLFNEIHLFFPISLTHSSFLIYEKQSEPTAFAKAGVPRFGFDQVFQNSGSRARQTGRQQTFSPSFSEMRRPKDLRPSTKKELGLFYDDDSLCWLRAKPRVNHGKMCRPMLKRSSRESATFLT